MLGLFEIDCIIDGASIRLTFYVVPIETVTFAAILGRDYILSHGRDVSSLIDREKNRCSVSFSFSSLSVDDEKDENKVPHTDGNEHMDESNDIFQVDQMIFSRRVRNRDGY